MRFLGSMLVGRVRRAVFANLQYAMVRTGISPTILRLIGTHAVQKLAETWEMLKPKAFNSSLLSYGLGTNSSPRTQNHGEMYWI